jgi:pyruvate dehydrogenase E2 component (dihydrolipoamide acetyltransferase)
MLVKACALALRAHPTANAAYVDGALDRFERVNVGIAVAAPGTLVVPVVFDADRKSLGEISTESRAAADRVRSGRVTPADLDGATFTVSNLGMMGIRRFTAVINPPQAAILAVGAARQEPVVTDGELGVATVLRATLAVDHRPVDGATGARWMAYFLGLLEAPLRILA